MRTWDWFTLHPVGKKDTILSGMGGAEDFTGGDLRKQPGIGMQLQKFKRLGGKGILQRQHSCRLLQKMY